MNEKLRQLIAKLGKRGRLLTSDAKKLLENLEGDELVKIEEELIRKDSKELFVTVEEIEKIARKRGAIELTEEVTPSSEVFHPISRGIEKRIKIIHNPGRYRIRGRSGDITDLLTDRLNKLSKVIMRREKVKLRRINEVIRSREARSIFVVGIVSRKKEGKKGLILEVEDPTGKMTCYVDRQRNRLVYEKAEKTPLDCVIGLRVRRIRPGFYYMENIILPEVKGKTTNRSQEEVYLVLTSDLHVGSKMFLKKAFMKFIFWLNGKYGNSIMKEIASRVKYVLIGGDLVDGVGVYPNQERQLEEINVEKQYRMASQLIEQIPDYIETLIIPGNHDATLHVLPQPPIWRKYSEILYKLPNVRMLGNPVNVDLHGVNVYSFHGVSLEDVLMRTPKLRKEKISEAMKILLMVRHICPIYGGKARIMPLKRDKLIVNTTPDIFHAGHIHINDHQKYGGVWIVNSGTWQAQTDYQRETGLVPTPGKVPVLNLATGELKILSFI